MIKINWIKFIDKVPTKHIIYVTDWCSVWPAFETPTWKDFAKNNPDYGWAEMPNPETPSRPSGLHTCGDSKEKTGFCTETVDKRLMYIYKSHHQEVKFCPFCGYEAINKGRGCC